MELLVIVETLLAVNASFRSEERRVGKGAQRKVAKWARSVKDAIMDFKNFNNSFTMIRSEGYL